MTHIGKIKVYLYMTHIGKIKFLFKYDSHWKNDASNADVEGQYAQRRHDGQVMPGMPFFGMPRFAPRFALLLLGLLGFLFAPKTDGVPCTFYHLHKKIIA